MTISAHWKRLRASRFKEPPQKPHAHVTFTELQEERRPVVRKTAELCRFVMHFQQTHDDSIEFLQNVNLMQLAITLPARTCCTSCDFSLQWLREKNVSMVVDQKQAVPPPTLRST